MSTRLPGVSEPRHRPQPDAASARQRRPLQRTSADVTNTVSGGLPGRPSCSLNWRKRGRQASMLAIELAMPHLTDEDFTVLEPPRGDVARLDRGSLRPYRGGQRIPCRDLRAGEPPEAVSAHRGPAPGGCCLPPHRPHLWERGDC